MLTPLGLAYLMFVVGLATGAPALVAAFRKPRLLALGAAGQILGLPALAVAIALALDAPPEIALGLLVLSAAPGGVTSNYIALTARGDAALSVALTVTSSGLAFLTAPLALATGAALLGAAGSQIVGVGDMVRMAAPILGVTLAPLALGAALRAKAPGWAMRREPLLRQLGAPVFLAVVLGAFAEHGGVLLAEGARASPVVLAFHASALLAGWALARAVRARPAEARSLVIELGLQNVALALFVAVELLGAPALAAPAIVYVVAMNVTALVLIIAGRRSAARGVEEGDPQCGEARLTRPQSSSQSSR